MKRFMHPLFFCAPTRYLNLTSILYFAAMNRFAWILLALLAACGGQRAANHPADTVVQGVKDTLSPAGAPTAAQPPPPPAADTAAPPGSDTTTTTTAPVSLPSNQSCSAMVDGMEWGGIQVIASRIDSAIAVTAIGPNGTSLILNLGEHHTPGHLKFGAANPGPFATWISPQGLSFSTEPAGSGSVRITRLDSKRVAGTFNFTATEQGGSGKVQIGNGKFDVIFGK